MKFLLPPLCITLCLAVLAACAVFSKQDFPTEVNLENLRHGVGFLLCGSIALLPVFFAINLADLLFDKRPRRWLWTSMLVILLASPGWLKVLIKGWPADELVSMLAMSCLVLLPMSVIRRKILPLLHKASAGSV